MEGKAQSYAVAHVVPEHLEEVRAPRLELLGKTEAAVKERLTKEISYWDHRAEQLKLQEQTGKINAPQFLASEEARGRPSGAAREALGRAQARAQHLTFATRGAGGLLVVPMGLLAEMAGRAFDTTGSAKDTQAAAARARDIIMEVERGLGFDPTDREFEKLGYDIESRIPGTGRLRFIEVKGRVEGAPTITVTKNEILYEQAGRLHPGHR